jgi:hypothetical protein
LSRRPLASSWKSVTRANADTPSVSALPFPSWRAAAFRIAALVSFIVCVAAAAEKSLGPDPNTKLWPATRTTTKQNLKWSVASRFLPTKTSRCKLAMVLPNEEEYSRQRRKIHRKPNKNQNFKTTSFEKNRQIRKQ